eukprot:TRINITY_DN4247_c0_g1_i1.p1 TRINITY_DN4247_c0_g1~~TRINITY_DN4247_c0_g1_i1.p1  ORF type:complete len:1069 (+),score=321.55 TRINITY_DN4247_c0_g1_i1:59-3265(+)
MLIIRKHALRKGARWVSNRMRNEEHTAMAQERLNMMSPEGIAGGSSGAQTHEFLSAKKLEEIHVQSLFQCSDTAKQLESPGNFVRLVVSKSEGSKLSDKWCATFLMSLYQAMKRHHIIEAPAKIIVQTIKMFQEKNRPFIVGASASNTLLTVMYQEKVDIQAIYSVYSKFKEMGIKPNHQTYALMFSVSLRAHKAKNTENFFGACEKLISNNDFSYAGKVDIIQSVCFGIVDAQHSGYATRLISLLRSLCVVEGATPQQLPARVADRNGSHLYLSVVLAERVFWACSRSRSPDLLDLLRQWYDFFNNRNIHSVTVSSLLMRAYASNSDMQGAFDIWNALLAQTQGNEAALRTSQTKSACINVMEAAARTKVVSFLSKSREMMDTMLEKGVISSSSDKVDLFIMQIKLFVLANDYAKAKDLYEQIKREVKDSKVIKALCSGPYAKENLEVLKEIFMDFKALAASSNEKINLDDALDKYLAVLADCGEFQEVLSVMENLEAGKVSLPVVHKVLHACARDKDATSYGTFYKWSEGGQDDMPLFFSHLKNNKTTKKNCTVAQGIFDSMKNFNLQPTTQTYNQLMAVYTAAGDFEEVSRIYDILKKTPGLEPDQFSFYYVARAWAGRGAVDMVEGVFNELFDASQDSKEVVFSPEFCAQAIRALSNTGMKIETVAYMRNITPGEEEMDWLDDLPTKVITTKQPRPVEVDMGFKLVNVLKELSLHPGIKVYTALLGLCTRAGDYKRAEEVYKMLKEDDTENIYDRSDIVTSLMKMHYTRQNMDDAMSLLDEVMQTEGCRLDLTAYHNCISTCALQGSVINAKHVLNTMFEDANVRVSDTAIALSLVACAHSEIEDDGVTRMALAREIINEQRELHKLHRQKVPVVNSQHVFHKMLYVAAAEKNTKEALDLLQEMRDLSVAIDKVTMLYLARCMSSVSELPTFWNIMEREGLQPDTGIIFRLLQVTQSSRDPFTALDIILKYHELVNEKLQLIFLRTVEGAKLSSTDYKVCDVKFHGAFGKTLHDVHVLANRRAKEQAQEASQLEKHDEPVKAQDPDDLNELFGNDAEGTQEVLF